MDNQNDIYNGDLLQLKKNVSKWTSQHPKHIFYMVLRVLLIVGGFGGMYYAYTINPELASKQGITYFTGTVLAILIIMIGAGKDINNRVQPPFSKLYNARFEATDKGILCIYQQGMSEFTYSIKDNDIKEWIIDDKANCFRIEGWATITEKNKKGINRIDNVEVFYMLFPFDSYDIEDLVSPYEESGVVKSKSGSLRRMSDNEGLKVPYIIGDRKKPIRPKKAGSSKKKKKK